MSVIDFPSGRAGLAKQRDDIAKARGYAMAKLYGYVVEHDGMVTTASWVLPDGTDHHRVSVFGLRDRDFHQSVTVESASIVTSLMQCLDRLQRDDWDKGSES
nr:MAG TPA_asm: hypothetical protein [Caudoviricetes sp.]